MSVPEGDVLDNRHLGDQQSSDPKRDLLSPAAAVAGIAGLAAAKKAARAASAGKPAAMKGIDVAAKWGGAKPKAAAGAPHPPHSQAQLDAQLLRQKIETEVFGLPLRRADQITSDKANSVKLTFANDTLAITANTPDVGSGRESIAIKYKGPEIEVAFNPTFLMDPLKVLEGDEVFFELTDSLSPGVLKSNTPFLYVLMPMRTH